MADKVDSGSVTELAELTNELAKALRVVVLSSPQIEQALERTESAHESTQLRQAVDRAMEVLTRLRVWACKFRRQTQALPHPPSRTAGLEILYVYLREVQRCYSPY